MEPLILQVPITVQNGKTQIGKPILAKETPESAQKLAATQLSSANTQLDVMRGKLKPAEAAYKANSTSTNFKRVESIKAKIAQLLQEIKKARGKIDSSYKGMIRHLRQKIRSLKLRLKMAKGNGAQKILNSRLGKTVNHYYDLRIGHVNDLIKKNRSNAAAIRRHVTTAKNIIASIVAQEGRNVIPNPVLKVRRLKLSKQLRRMRGDLSKANHRYKFLIKKLNMLKAAKNRFNAKRGLAVAVAGATGAMHKMRELVMKHDRILKELMGKKSKRCMSLQLQRLKLNAALGRLAKVKNSLKKRPGNKRLKEALRRMKIRVARLREKVAAAVKCRGMIICGNLRKAMRNLENAKSAYAKAAETARNRPSDEDAQKDRIKFEKRIKKHRAVIKAIWKCICNRAQKKFHQYEDLYARKKLPIYRRRMLLHKDMLRKCNCRAANINFSRARRSFIVYRNRFQSNPMDQTAKEKMEQFYKSVLVHYERMKMYKCKLPPLPRKIQAVGGTVQKKRVNRGGR
jgi:hypothetical protein